MNERIKEIRDKLKLSRAAFGDKLGVSGDTVNNWERGRAEITDRVVKLICNTFDIQEDWLRTGNGAMFEEELDIDDDMQVLGLLGVDPDDPFARFVLDVAKVYYTLSEDGRAAVQDFCHKVYLEAEKRNKKEDE